MTIRRTRFRFATPKLIALLPLLLAACSVIASDPASAGAGSGRGALYGDLLAGQYAAGAGDHAAAAHYFSAALDQDPTSSLLLQQSFASALIAGSPTRYALARRLPENPLGAMILGDHAILSGDYTEAAAKFAAMPTEGLTSLLRPLLIAWANQGAGDTDRAIALLRPLTESPPFGPVYALHAALIADLSGREAEAEKFYGLATNGSQPPDLIFAEALASWQARQGNTARAEAIMLATTTAHPGLDLAARGLEASLANPLVTSARAGAAIADFQLAGALNAPNQIVYQLVLLNEALTLDPHFVPAILLRANIAIDDHDTTLAQTLLASIPQSDPLYPMAVMRRAALAEDAGKGMSMLPDLTAIAGAAPQNPAPLELAGDIARRAKRYSEAKAFYTRALDELGSNPPQIAWSLYFGRAVTEDKLDDWPAAKADLDRALTLAPDQPDVLNYLGYSEAIRGEDLHHAQKLVEHALQAAPKEGEIIDSLGYILLKRGMIAKAMEVQITAVEHSPDDPEINAHLAEIFDAAGNHLAARYQWQRSLALHPDPDQRAKIEAGLKRDSTQGGT